MSGLRFSEALLPGFIAGVISIFFSWLWMGAVFHRFQKLTPLTWRPETGLSHTLSSILHIFACIGIAVLFATVALAPTTYFAPDLGSGLRFGFLCWCVLALPMAVEASVYINLHPLVVVGQLLDWLGTSLLACMITGWWLRR